MSRLRPYSIVVVVGGLRGCLSWWWNSKLWHQSFIHKTQLVAYLVCSTSSVLCVNKWMVWLSTPHTYCCSHRLYRWICLTKTKAMITCQRLTKTISEKSPWTIQHTHWCVIYITAIIKDFSHHLFWQTEIKYSIFWQLMIKTSLNNVCSVKDVLFQVHSLRLFTQRKNSLYILHRHCWKYSPDFIW